MGVQQGDPLGPLLFSLVLADLLDQISIPGIMLSVWYLDDGTIVGSCSAILEFLSRVETLGPLWAFFLTSKNVNCFGHPKTNHFWISSWSYVDLLMGLICWALQCGALIIF